MSMTAVDPHERDASISWLRVKCIEGTAGLDPYDRTVMIVEVTDPNKAWRLDHIGHVLETHPHVRPNRSTCIRIRALLEADVRQELDLDGDSPPVLTDTALASRHPDASLVIAGHDQSRRAGRSYPR
jgi:hypothetical protein